jgi:hypothetical protein
MARFRIDLLDEFDNEILLTVTTSEDLIAVEKSGWLDCWIDAHSPKTRWSKIVGISRNENYQVIEETKTRVNRYVKSKGRANKDNRVKPGEPKSINKTNN